MIPPLQEGGDRSHGRVWVLDMPGWRWTHYDLVTSAAFPAIQAEGWGEDVLALMRDKDETPRLQSQDGLVMGILPDFPHQAGLESREAAYWRFAMREDRIVTGRRSSVDGLYHAWQAAREGHAPESPAALVDLMLAHFGTGVAQRAAALDDEARRIEDDLLSDEPKRGPDESGRRLGVVRRDATRLTRVVVPVVRLLREEEEELPDWAVEQSHETARRRILSALDDLRALQEHGRALQDELSARQAAETNRNVNTLSVITAVLLPPSLVAGFFGMNTGGMAWAEPEHGTLWAAGLMLGSVAVTLLLLRLRRVI